MKRLICTVACLLLLIGIATFSFAESAPILTLNETNIVLAQGKTLKLIPTAENVENAKKLKYTWQSSDEQIATVNNGIVKAVNAGNTKIVCSTTLEDGTMLSAEAQVEVIIPIKSIKMPITKEETLSAGNTYKLNCTITPDDATNQALEWTSSDPTVASVDENGTVTARAAGKVTITAKTKDGSNKTANAKFYIPSMDCSMRSVNVNSTKGSSFVLHYFGTSWNDVTITTKGNCFNYSAQKSGTDVTIQLTPNSPGSGTISFRDKKDAKSAFSVDVYVTNEAISLNQYVLITDVKVKNDTVNISYKNNTTSDIAIVEFRFIPYNQWGEMIFYSNMVEDGEFKYFSHESTLRSGKAGKDSIWLSGYDGMSSVDVAVDYIRLSNGEIIRLSDNHLYWYSSKTNQYKAPPTAEAVNCEPSQSEKDKDESFKVGYTYILVEKELAKHYGYKHGGLYITEIVPDSMSDKAGLKVKDLIIAVDGIMLEDDKKIFDKAKARIADGGSFTVTVERYAQEGTLDLVFMKESPFK